MLIVIVRDGQVRSYVYFKSCVRTTTHTTWHTLWEHFRKYLIRLHHDWKSRAFAFGSVKDRPRSGRKKTREETCAGVAASIEKSPIKSTRKLGISRTTMRYHIKKDMKVRPFRPLGA
ncbi:hypothetical protein C0J52_19722 [Blattella germanica]|nr:hypothetical protein C0J52_19722 [Blattella germanica]